MRRCPNCRATEMVRTDHDNYHYTESGLDNVFVDGVTTFDCPSCGERVTRFFAMEKLHEAIARAIVARPGRLAPMEIRFLRKHLGYSNQDFARRMGVTPETSSRWASGDLGMNGSAEVLLRLLVRIGEKVEQYPAPEDEADPQPIHVKFERGTHDWASVSLARSTA